MTEYTIVTDECQRVLNAVSDELFAIRTDYQHVSDNIETLRGHVCGSVERIDQSASQNDLDSALTTYYEEVDEFFEELRLDLGNVYLAMQDVLNYFVSGDAEMKHNSRGTAAEFPYELTTSGEGDPPPAYDTRDMWEGHDDGMTTDLGDGTSGLYDTAYRNHLIGRAD